MSIYSDNYAYFCADNYFRHQMERIELADSRGSIKFIDADSSGKCYHFSTWALLGLQKDDRRLVGTIDTIPHKNYKVSHDYAHAWVEFKVPMESGEDWFVYDPLYSKLVQRDIWYEACTPREIISNLSQQEVVQQFLAPKYIHDVQPGLSCVFKCIDAVPEEANNKKNGYLFNALSEGYLFGQLRSKEHFYTSYFIAHRY